MCARLVHGRSRMFVKRCSRQGGGLFKKGHRRNVVTRRHGLSYCGNWAPLMCTGRGLLWVTVIRWHRAGFRAYWRRKSRPRSGRPKTPLEIRQLIREISLANPLWGAPRIHGELLKLGIDVGQTTVAKYMARRRRPPSQGWKTFLHNHADGIASMDLFVVPTISFRLLYGLLILHHDRRQILGLGVSAHPTAEWISHQLTAPD